MSESKEKHDKMTISSKLSRVRKNLEDYKKCITNLYEENIVLKEKIEKLEKENTEIKGKETIIKQEREEKEEEIKILKKEKLIYFFENRIFETLEKLCKVKPEEEPEWYKEIKDLDWSTIKKAYKELKNGIREEYNKNPEKYPEKDEINIKKSELEEYAKMYVWPDQYPFSNINDNDIVTFAVRKKGWKAGEHVLIPAELNHIKLKKPTEEENTTENNLKDSAEAELNNDSITESVKDDINREVN